MIGLIEIFSRNTKHILPVIMIMMLKMVDLGAAAIRAASKAADLAKVEKSPSLAASPSTSRTAVASHSSPKPADSGIGRTKIIGPKDESQTQSTSPPPKKAKCMFAVCYVGLQHTDIPLDTKRQQL